MAEPKIRASNQINFDADLDLNAKKLTNLASPASSGDAATKGYVDGLVVGLLDDRGNYDASGNGFPTTGGSGTAGAIMKGDLWYISVAGTLGGKACDIGFSIRALVDTPGQTAGNWSILSSGLSFTPENSANKVTAFSTPTDVQYPSAKLVKDQLDSKVIANNAITGATKTKITYDAKGLVTGGADATTADIADSTDKRYCTDAQKTVIGNTSGTNSGNETTTTVGALVNGATEKTTPIDADMVGLMDSAASNLLKKLSWANIKATLKTYFDTIYAAAGSGLSVTNYVCREAPSGTKNGSNVTFTLANTPTSGTEMIFRNGLLLISGAGNSYTISGGTITMAIAPQSDDTLYATYFK